MNEFIINFLNKNIEFRQTNKQDANYNYYLQQKDELKDAPQYDYNYLVDLVNNSKLRDYYIKSMNDFNVGILYKSYTHGINHNIRVSILALVICIFENMDKNELDLALDAAKYHDVGRINDETDDEHGLRSSKMLGFLEDKYAEEDMKILKAIVTAHSIDDEKFEEVVLKYKITNVDKCQKLFKVIKDADALDRTRLEEDPIIKVDMLRYDCSKKMVTFAYDLVNNYYDYIGKNNG